MSKAKLPDWIWIDDKGAMHVDADLYAELRGISQDQAMVEIRKHFKEILPDAEIFEQEKKGHA